MIRGRIRVGEDKGKEGKGRGERGREIQLWCRNTGGSWGSRWGCFHVFKENDLLLMVEKINYCFLS